MTSQWSAFISASQAADRAKLCATALGFDSPTRFATSSDGPPLKTDALSPSASLSCSRPKQAMLGSSTPPITSPPASSATATRNPSPSRKPTPASKSLGPEAIAPHEDAVPFEAHAHVPLEPFIQHMVQEDVCEQRRDDATLRGRRVSTILGYRTHILAKD